jgi:hypothetical protein
LEFRLQAARSPSQFWPRKRGTPKPSRDFGVAGIALGRDVDADGSVDVLGVQLEEVV